MPHPRCSECDGHGGDMDRATMDPSSRRVWYECQRCRGSGLEPIDENEVTFAADAIIAIREREVVAYREEAIRLMQKLAAILHLDANDLFPSPDMSSGSVAALSAGRSDQKSLSVVGQPTGPLSYTTEAVNG